METKLRRPEDPLDFARRTRVLLMKHTESKIDIDVAFGGLPLERAAIQHSGTLWTAYASDCPARRCRSFACVTINALKRRRSIAVYGRNLLRCCGFEHSLFMGILTPRLNILPESQKLLWNRLKPTPNHFVLYGGTALALRLGHRSSVDFDFFSCRSFQPLELARLVPYLKDQTITQESADTLSCEILTEKGTVKVSFFGGLSLRQIDTPDTIDDNGIAIASLKDLFGMKCATVPQRNEAKDYLDIHALITKAKINLSEGVAAARAIYGRQYNPVLTLQALSYFDDLPDPLPGDIKADLLVAVKSVSLQELPVLTASQKIGEGIRRIEP